MVFMELVVVSLYSRCNCTSAIQRPGKALHNRIIAVNNNRIQSNLNASSSSSVKVSGIRSDPPARHPFWLLPCHRITTSHAIFQKRSVGAVTARCREINVCVVSLS
jgi:hypothetical protein